MSHLFTVSVHWFNAQISSQEIKKQLADRELDTALINLSATSSWGPHDVISFETESLTEGLEVGWELYFFIMSRVKDGTGMQLEINGKPVFQFLKEFEADISRCAAELKKTRTRFASPVIRDVRRRLEKYTA